MIMITVSLGPFVWFVYFVVLLRCQWRQTAKPRM